MALGAGSFGGLGSPLDLVGRGLDEPNSVNVLSEAVDAGIALVDSAHSYAAGAADRIVGTWIAGDTARRERIAIVAKLGVVAGRDGLQVDLSAANVLRCAAETRDRMHVDAVDVVMSHSTDPATPWTETLSAFGELIEAGYATHYGVSNVELPDLEAVLATADELGMPPPLLVENEFNLTYRGDETAVLPFCARHGIGYLAYSPLAGGLLTGKYRLGEPPPAGSQLGSRPDDQLGRLTEEVESALRTLETFASSLGLSLPALGLAWVVATPGVRPIVGVTKPAQLEAARQALARPLTAPEAAYVSDVFPAAT